MAESKSESVDADKDAGEGMAGSVQDGAKASVHRGSDDSRTNFGSFMRMSRCVWDTGPASAGFPIEQNLLAAVEREIDQARATIEPLLCAARVVPVTQPTSMSSSLARPDSNSNSEQPFRTSPRQESSKSGTIMRSFKRALSMSHFR